MKSLVRLLRSMSRWERWTLAVLCALFLFGFIGLLRAFYVENTVLLPTTGGTYIEGAVGDLRPINPWFTTTNDVNRDIASLVFAGLLKYDPLSRKIVDDLATLQSSANNTSFTLRLKENVFWHDSTEKDPHPVTADDVVFTYATIQNPQFPNPILAQNYRGVQIEKVDSRTVTFKLDQPYSFFPSNLTLGLLPKRSFENIPVSKLDLATDFGYQPIGAGPYKLKTIVHTDLSSEVTLERFSRSLPPPYHLERIVFRIFPDYGSLLSDLGNLQGVRLVPRNDQGEPMISRRFVARTYYLPQYVALFFNLGHKNLQDQKLRLGLQLGTNKQELANSVHESVLVDTPLLELDTSDWHYHYDLVAAQGALFASNWNQPEKIRLQHLLEQHDTNTLGILHVQPVVYLETGAVLTVTGSLVDVQQGFRLNGLPIAKHPTASGTWIVALPTEHGTGALALGENVLRVTDEDGKIIDTGYVFRARTPDQFRRASEEQRLVQLFLKTRSGLAASGQLVTVQSLFLDGDFLRLRTPADPVNVRRNERGDQLVLHLLTSAAPPEYRKIAEFIRSSWAALGVQVIIDVPPTRDEFQSRLLRRDYDVVLFGESLLDNLDAYPYWHSSGVQKVSGDPKELRQDAYNLSQYVSRQADALLETIRRTSDDQLREKSLQDLRNLLKEDVPAIFLYSPLYTFAQRADVQGVQIGNLSLHSDRFLTLSQWYVQQERVFKPGKNWLSFFGWLPSIFHKSSPVQ